MRIAQIIVTGLFDRFNHDLVFKPHDSITIMIGPNGFGKTMTLRIINALFTQPVRSLARMPFRQVLVKFDDGSQLRVVRTPMELDDGTARNDVRLTYTYPLGVEETFVPEAKINPKDIGVPIGSIEDIIPALDQIGPAEWRDRRSGETLSLDDVLDRFGHEIPLADGDGALSALPKWLQEIRKSIPVRFIDTERLTSSVAYSSRTARLYRHTPLPATARTVRRYSEELAERVRKTLTEYGSLAQSLDRTFPVRLVEEPARSDLAMDKLRADLAEVETKRSRLVDAGLIAQELEGWGVPALDKVDESRRGVLAVYARDAQKKLGVFDDLYARVDTLKRIANSRLLHKRVTVGSDGLSVIASNGSRLELEMLSSGEQHELVILYELLFRVPRNAFILIDEPELSLHVAWQEQFLDDLAEIAQLSKFRVLLATHSPQIIGDRWDLTVELKGPEDQ